MKATNFEAGAFSVNQINGTSRDVCLNIAKPGLRTLRKEKVNGVTFTVFETGGVGLGHSIDGEAYRSFHRNTCYELDIRVASASMGDFDPGTVREFDYEVVYRSLKSVVTTFEFLK